MANLFDYLYWRGGLSVEREPLNPVDALILSWCASMPLKNPLPDTLGEAARSVNTEFARAIASSRRFAPMKLYRFEEKFSEGEQMQFACLTLLTGDGRAFIAFRGTDSTLVGWKEDFNMAFSDEVPAQREATAAVNRIGAELQIPLRIGGHSKGGNLAVYAASRCRLEIRKYITRVYNFDGPGLSPAVMSSTGHIAVEPKIETYLPDQSVVGILLERSARYHVVKSDASGLMQHSPYTWQVTPDNFVLLDELGWQSLYADRTIREWLESMTQESRERFVNALYAMVESTDAKTLGEISEDRQKSVWNMLGAFTELDLRTKATLFVSLGRLIRSAVKNWNNTMQKEKYYEDSGH